MLQICYSKNPKCSGKVACLPCSYGPRSNKNNNFTILYSYISKSHILCKPMANIFQRNLLRQKRFKHI